MTVSPYVVAIGWLMLSLLIGNGNDIIMKYIGAHLPSIEISFLRFFFSALFFLPLLVFQGRQAFHTRRLGMHVVRGAILFVAMWLWVEGITSAPITTAIVINFSMPFFVLGMSRIVLKEQVDWRRWGATILGFTGVLIVMAPGGLHMDNASLPLLIASMLFASLDVINKRFSASETMISMLCYSSIATALLSLPPAILVWVPLEPREWGWILLLGLGANLVLYCLLKAFRLADVSAIAPLRYLELLIGSLTAYLFFQEIPLANTWLGAALIIPASLFVVISESRKKHS